MIDPMTYGPDDFYLPPPPRWPVLVAAGVFAVGVFAVGAALVLMFA